MKWSPFITVLVLLNENGKTVLFLGAGASRVMGFPTTKDFLDRLVTELQPIKDSSEILNVLRNLDGVQDIEHILQILDDILGTDQSSLRKLFRKYPPVLNLPPGRNWNWQDFLRAAGVLVEQIRDAVYRYYEFDPTLESQAVALYGPLFDILTKLNRYEVPVFTTNYDKVIEVFVSTVANYDLIDGFVSPRKNTLAEWKPNVFRTMQREPRILVKLFKLHGSLDWLIRKSDDCPVKVEHAEYRVRTSRKFKGNALIYPAGKEEPVSEPFLSLHANFSEYASACSQIIVIGFAFRDEYLGQIFIEFLRREKTNRIIVISPSAKEATKNLLGPHNDLEKQVIALEDSFGENKTLSHLKSTVATALGPA